VKATGISPIRTFKIQRRSDKNYKRYAVKITSASPQTRKIYIKYEGKYEKTAVGKNSLCHNAYAVVSILTVLVENKL
jgi:hypothetical protein